MEVSRQTRKNPGVPCINPTSRRLADKKEKGANRETANRQPAGPRVTLSKPKPNLKKPKKSEVAVTVRLGSPTQNSVSSPGQPKEKSIHKTPHGISHESIKSVLNTAHENGVASQICLSPSYLRVGYSSGCNLQGLVTKARPVVNYEAVLRFH